MIIIIENPNLTLCREWESLKHSALSRIYLSNPSPHNSMICAEENAERLQEPEVIDDLKETWPSKPNRTNLYIWTHRDGYSIQAQTRQNPKPRKGCRNKFSSLTNKLFLIDTAEKENWVYPKWSIIRYINNTPGQAPSLGVLGQHKADWLPILALRVCAHACVYIFCFGWWFFSY